MIVVASFADSIVAVAVAGGAWAVTAHRNLGWRTIFLYEPNPRASQSGERGNRVVGASSAVIRGKRFAKCKREPVS